MVDTTEVFELEERREVQERIERKKPWSNYKEMLQMPQMGITDLIERIVDSAKINRKLAAATALLYLTASRIHEVLPYIYRGRYVDKLPKITKHGIRIKDIREEFLDGTTWVFFNSRNEKQSTHRGNLGVHHNGVSLDERYKSLLKPEYKPLQKLLFEEGCPDYPLILFVKNYIIDLQNERPMDEEDEIFIDISHGELHYFLYKYIKVTPHVLRHLRMQHLRKIHNFDVQDLKEYGGWKSAVMPLKYSKSSTQQIGDRFLQQYKESLEKVKLLHGNI